MCVPGLSLLAAGFASFPPVGFRKHCRVVVFTNHGDSDTRHSSPPINWLSSITSRRSFLFCILPRSSSSGPALLAKWMKMSLILPHTLLHGIWFHEVIFTIHFSGKNKTCLDASSSFLLPVLSCQWHRAVEDSSTHQCSLT